MSGVEQEQNVNFTVDQNNLYRQEVVTDFKVASIMKFTPVKPNGTEDTSRTAIFLGQSQVMLPQGPTPIQARIEANNLEEAMEAFPEAMKQSMNQTMSQMAERVLQREQSEPTQQKKD